MKQLKKAQSSANQTRMHNRDTSNNLKRPIIKQVSANQQDPKSTFNMYLTQAVKSSSLFAFILVSLLLIKNVQSQKYQLEGDVGERVEKIPSGLGEFYLGQQQQPNWYQQALLNGKTALVQEDLPYDDYLTVGSIDGRQVVVPTLARLDAGSRQDKKLRYLDLDGAGSFAGVGRNYRALVDDFKHSAQLAREGRAFKPKLMSTARGFGKRAGTASDFHVSYADLLASANRNEALNGKMSANAIR